jgi:prevent-host-death family protein
MKTISAAELRRDLSDVLDIAEAGRRILVTRHGRPVAVLCPFSEADPASGAVDDDSFAVREGGATYTTATPATLPSGFAVRHGQWSDRLFASAGVRRVLSLFMLQPERVFYQREVARSADVPLRSAQLALDRLVGLGLIDAERSGNRMHYSTVRSPAFDSLREWVLSEVALVPVLREALQPLAGSIEAAFVYGSTASGEDTATSDIDLMIVGEVDAYALYDSLQGLYGRLGREINVTHYDAAEFREKLTGGSHFIASVMRGPLLWVFGEENLGAQQ